MARRKKAKLLGSRAGATQTRILYQLNYDAGAPNILIDTAKDLSLVNHRMYKQNRNYVVRLSWGGTVSSGTAGTTPLAFYAAQNTWQIRKAFAYAQKTYWQIVRKSMQKGQKIGRWHQFKIDQLVAQEGLGHFTPSGISNAGFDWPRTELANLTGAGNFSWGLTGTSGGSDFSCLDAYDSLEDAPQDIPAMASAQMPYAAVDPDPVSENSVILRADHDNPPYNPTNLQHQYQYFQIAPGTVGGTTIHPQSTPWFTAPCGLIKVEGPSANATHWTNNILVLEVAAGPYKGVLSEAM